MWPKKKKGFFFFLKLIQSEQHQSDIRKQHRSEKIRQGKGMLKEQKRKMKSQENNWNVKYCLNKWRQFGAKLELNSLKIISSISDEHQALLMEMLPARVPLAQNMVQMSSATAWFWIIWWRHASAKTWTWQSNHHTQLCVFPQMGLRSNQVSRRAV